MTWKKVILWIAILAAAVSLVLVPVMRNRGLKLRTINIQGAVIRKDKDPRRQLPIGDVQITATDGVASASGVSDSSGYFHLRLRENVWPSQPLQISFQRRDYQPYELTIPVGLRTATEKLYVAEMTPSTEEPEAQPGKGARITNVRIRYTVNIEGSENIGSAVRTFQVVNRGNVPCNRQGPCSPDGRWKAATDAVTLDAGPNNEFRNVRASCIAGPCPFTRIDPSGFEHGGRTVTASALDWSDTATFLVEAEVFRTSINASVRESYPVIFGRTLNFVLPASQEGASIEAELDGTPMVFPLGPELYLSWATCNARASRDSASSTVYRCELKPEYRF